MCQRAALNGPNRSIKSLRQLAEAGLPTPTSLCNRFTVIGSELCSGRSANALSFRMGVAPSSLRRDVCRAPWPVLPVRQIARGGSPKSPHHPRTRNQRQRGHVAGTGRSSGDWEGACPLIPSASVRFHPIRGRSNDPREAHGSFSELLDVAWAICRVWHRSDSHPAAIPRAGAYRSVFVHA